MAWTYLLECSDGSYYVGSTTDLALRIDQHNSGAVAAYTRTRLPVTLLWAGEFETLVEAYAFERQVHGWSRAKKSALARGMLEQLPVLSSRSYDGRVARKRSQISDRPPERPGAVSGP